MAITRVKETRIGDEGDLKEFGSGVVSAIIKMYRIIVSISLVVLVASCTRVVRLDSPDFSPDYEHATLIFQTDELPRSLWPFIQYDLWLKVYWCDENRTDKTGCVGTVKLTSGEKSKSVFIPSDRLVFLFVHYSSFIVAEISSCMPSIAFRPKASVTYKLLFQHDPSSCEVTLLNAVENEELENGNVEARKDWRVLLWWW